MLTLVLASCLVATPSFAVVVSREVDVKPEVLARVTTALEAALAAEKVPAVMGASSAASKMSERGLEPSSSCENGHLCLLGLMHVLEVDMLIAVDLGHVLDQYALHLSALDGGQAPIVERTALVKERRFDAALADEVRAFAQELARTLQAKGLLAVELPVFAPSPRPAVAASSPQRPLVMGSAALAGVSWIAALAFTITGTVAKGSLAGQQYPVGTSTASHLTRAQADALAGRANAWFTAGLVAAVVGTAAVALLGFVLWLD